MTHAENAMGGVEGADVSTLILAKIRVLEEKAELVGWDVPPTLWFLGRDGLWGSVPAPVPDPAPEALELLARMLPLPIEPFEGAIKAAIDRDPVAVVFMCEAWQNDQFTTEQEREVDPRPLVDIPGSVEVRVVSAVDLEGRRYWASRVRGQEPTVHAEGPGEDDWQASGRVFDSLTKIATVLREARDRRLA